MASNCELINDAINSLDKVSDSNGFEIPTIKVIKERIIRFKTTQNKPSSRFSINCNYHSRSPTVRQEILQNTTNVGRYKISRHRSYVSIRKINNKLIDSAIENLTKVKTSEISELVDIIRDLVNSKRRFNIKLVPRMSENEDTPPKGTYVPIKIRELPLSLGTTPTRRGRFTLSVSSSKSSGKGTRKKRARRKF